MRSPLRVSRRYGMNKNRVKAVGKWACLLAGGVLLVVVGWYAFFRLMSRHNAVSLYRAGSYEVTPSSSESGRFTIGSFNIAHGRGPVKGDSNWQDRSRGELVAHLDAIAGQLREAGADIVVLNEVDFASGWSFHLNQARYLARRAGYPHVAEQRNIDVSLPFYSFRFGNAILSRYPLRDVQYIELPPFSRREDLLGGNHDSLFAMADTSVGPVGILAVHLEYRSEAFRVRCAGQIIELGRSMPFPVIAAGDFNSTPAEFPGSQRTGSGRNAVSVLLEEGFVRDPELAARSEDFTFPSEDPEIIIDWVLGKGVDIAGARVIPSALSDHLMVTATIRESRAKQ